MSKVVLITGCSSGIGAAMALDFHRRGHKVYATARRAEALTSLAEQGLQTLVLDVDSDESIAAASAMLGEREGRLDILVNNAGFSQVGAILDLKREDLRAQYETNVISPVAVLRAMLPLLRAGDSPRVVNIGSIVGLFTTPFAGAYCSSKAAFHALSDALRMELAPFGVQLVLVQPGGVKSSFGNNAEAALQLPAGSLYQPMQAGIAARAQAGQQGATPTEDFVRPVVDKVLMARPPAIIRGGKGSVQLVALKRLLPLRWFDAMMARRFGLASFNPD